MQAPAHSHLASSAGFQWASVSAYYLAPRCLDLHSISLGCALAGVDICFLIRSSVAEGTLGGTLGYTIPGTTTAGPTLVVWDRDDPPVQRCRPVPELPSLGLPQFSWDVQSTYVLAVLAAKIGTTTFHFRRQENALQPRSTQTPMAASRMLTSCPWLTLSA